MTYSLSRAPNRLFVVVRPRFSLYRFLFVPFWAAMWVALLITNPAGKPVSAFGFLGFGLITVLLGYQWFWNLFGREELEFATHALTYRRLLFGISRTRMFVMDRITDPHFVESRSRGISGRTLSGLGFSYDGKSVRLCDHLTQAEAKGLASAVAQQLPQHAELWKHYKQGMPELDESIALGLK
jgi:hypothetical protein